MPKIFCNRCGDSEVVMWGKCKFCNGEVFHSFQKDTRKKWQIIRDQVFEGYGGKHCACCRETEVLFLELDHVNNDGYKHRREIKGYNLYRWAIKNKFPKTLQILCSNCNQGKRRNNGICPHVKQEI